MPAGDKQTATLRALLTGKFDLYKEMLGDLVTDDDKRGYLDLVAGAFVKMARLTFDKEDDVTAAVVEWMGTQGRAAIQEYLPRELVARRALGEISSEQMMADLTTRTYTFGHVTPDTSGFYVAGTWDDVRNAWSEGHLSDAEFEVIRQAVGVEW